MKDSSRPSRHVLSVDVEDYFHVEAFTDIVKPSAWQSYSSRVEANTDRLLDLCDEWGVKGTFFILGWVAERSPGLVKKIARRGHELGCHSFWHRLIYRLTPQEFRDDTRRAKDCIEQAAGGPVYGYRAPSFSVTAQSRWSPEILAELGFRYDSSIFPVRHDTYGVPNAPRGPFLLSTPSGDLQEYPLTTFRLGSGGSGPNFPIGGGGYLRIFPPWYTRMGMQSIQREGLGLISYVHPWEIDPDQPRLPARFKSRLRHYTNLSKMESRLAALVRSADFGPFRDLPISQSLQKWSL